MYFTSTFPLGWTQLSWSLPSLAGVLPPVQQSDHVVMGYLGVWRLNVKACMMKYFHMYAVHNRVDASFPVV